MNTSELTRLALNWAVAQCLGLEVTFDSWGVCYIGKVQRDESGLGYPAPFEPSHNWAQGGPIIEREKITVVCAEGAYNQSKAGTPDCYDTYWVAEKGRLSAGTSYGPQGDDWGEGFHIDVDCMTGPTPLIAAMRCYVASKMGDEIEIPEELK
jgi:hypothetical protein